MVVTAVTIMGYLRSAWKHGVPRKDIDHALNNPLAVHYYDDYVMGIGPTCSGDLLEVGVNNDENVFHAMPAREKFLRRK